MSDTKKFINFIFLNFIAILIGFFLAMNLSTILGQTGDWGMLSSGLLTALIEISSKLIYEGKEKINFIQNSKLKKNLTIFSNFLNNLKIGVLYGFFIESFKLGS